MAANPMSRSLIAAIVVAQACGSWAALGQGSARVIDGDSLELDGKPIRLFAIDSPERGEPGAREATDNLRRLITGKTVACQRIEFDRYDREVSLCSAGGVDLSFAQVRFGHAVVWCYYVRKNRPSMLATFRSAEAAAKKERRGIWARPFKPWRDWRC
jgi:endonuclease YncB( thermonuclease family)